MLVTFTTKAYADITMFGDVALALLKKMGHSATVPGAILAADVPAALSKLTAAIDAEKFPPPVADKDADEPAVSMAPLRRLASTTTTPRLRPLRVWLRVGKWDGWGAASGGNWVIRAPWSAIRRAR